MPLRIFVSSFLQEDEERRQMNNLLRSLDKFYKDRVDDCRIIVDVDPYRQMDAIMWKDDHIVILELKNHSGDILATDYVKPKEPSEIVKASPWKILRREGDLELENFTEQVTKQRSALIGFIIREAFNIDPAKRDEETGKLVKKVGEFMSGWIVVNNGVHVISADIDFRTKLWFKILHIDEVAEELVFLKRGDSVLGEDVFQKLIRKFRAYETTIDGWLSPFASKKNSKTAVRRAPGIDRLLQSKEPKDVVTALELVDSTELVPHYKEDVLRLCDSENPSIRERAIKMVIEWRFPEFPVQLSQALQDSSESIRSMALQFLIRNHVQGTEKTLVKLLNTSTEHNHIELLAAIGMTQDTAHCNSVLGHAGRFKQVFKQLDDALRSTESEIKKMRSAENHEKMTYREQDVLLRKRESIDRSRRYHLELFSALCETAIQLRCVCIDKWLCEIVDSPKNIGLDKESNFPEFSTYSTILYKAIETLGKLRSGDSVDLLLKKLKESPTDYRSTIITALGDIADKRPIGTVRKYLKDKDSHVRRSAIRALGVLKDTDSFEQIASRYDHDDYRDAVEHSLISIDAERFERFLLRKLESRIDKRIKIECIHSLFKVASIESVPVLFRCLKDPELGHASWILSKFAHEEMVFQEALNLTRSRHALERVSALNILYDYYQKNPDQLKQFENDEDEDVRCGVVLLYSQNNLTSHVLKFANDPSSAVRGMVFSHIIKIGKFEGHFTMLTEKKAYYDAEVAISQEIIGIRYEKNLLLTKRSSLKRAAILQYKGYDRGLYIKSDEGETRRTLLLDSNFPDRSYHSRDYITSLHTVLTDGLRSLGNRRLSKDELSLIRQNMFVNAQFDGLELAKIE